LPHVQPRQAEGIQPGRDAAIEKAETGSVSGPSDLPTYPSVVVAVGVGNQVNLVVDDVLELVLGVGELATDAVTRQ
jgi:hypothetical protein